MAISATFTADFTNFSVQVALAQTKLESFEKESTNVAASLTKMEQSISGTAIVQAATIAAEAVDRLGGVSKLTYAELQQLGSTAQEAAEKMTALGMKVPVGIQELADAAASAKEQMKGLGENSQTAAGMMTAIGETAAGFVTGQAGIELLKEAVRQLVAFLQESVAAAAEAQVAQIKLESALRNTHQNVEAVSAQYAAYAAQLQATTTLEDDAVIALAAYATEMGVTADQMGPLLKLSADLSAAWGIDMTSAIQDLVRAGEGSTRAFKAHGIELDENRVKAEGLSYVLPELAKHFDGNAAALLHTYTGEVTALSVAWGNLKEDVGRAGIALINATGFVPAMTDYFRGLTAAIEQYGYIGAAAIAQNTELITAMGKAANDAAAAGKRLGDINLDAPKQQTANLAAEMKALQAAVDALNPEQRKAIDLATDYGKSAAYIADKLKINVETVQLYVREQKEAAKSADDLAKAEQKAADDRIKAAEKLAKEVAKIEGDTHQQRSDWMNQFSLEERKTTQSRMENMSRASTAIQKAEADLHDYQMKQTLDTTTYQVMKIWEKADKEVAALKGTAEQNKYYADLIYQQAMNAQNDIYEAAAKKAKQTEDQILFDVVDMANKLKGITDDVKKDVAQTTGQLQTLIGGIKMAGSQVETAFGQQYLIGPNGQRIPLGPHGELPDNFDQMMGGASFSSGFSNQARIGTGFTPTGMSGGINIVNQITQPLGTPQAIASAVGDALMNQLRGQGVRTP